MVLERKNGYNAYAYALFYALLNVQHLRDLLSNRMIPSNKLDNILLSEQEMN